MKALELLSNSAKARLMHELFPGEIKDLLDYLTEYCEHLCSVGENYRKDWDSGLVSFDFWMALAAETNSLIKKHEFSMLRSSKVFSDQLFFTYTALFATDCIVKYAERQSTNEKFKIIVQLLFT
ncbi:hypothetical protein [Pedobacter aquatilis]|uniref:hypothetical protein n=1 Tax=Pedobacter aquatilis TaxID=351343 RepID=UPI002930BD06|nr:hypothetical protein [Pedobacter aquatilis]